MKGLRTVDLFSGAGGFTLGLRRSGVAGAITAVEIDRDCCETFGQNFPEARIVQGDVREVDYSGWEADLLTGGPPCQGFSKLNRGRAGDPRNGLSYEMVRCAKALRPRFVVVENVPAFLESREGSLLAEELRAAQYAVRAGVVNAADFGVPQRRLRAIVVAAARGLPVPWPAETHSAKGVELPPHRTVGDALAMLPEIPDGVNWHIDPERDQDVHGERFRSIREGGSRTDLPADLVLDCWKGTRGFGDVLGRLEWQRPSTTVRTEFFRAEKGRFLHPRADRPLTAREAARLQTFPDSFRFPEHHTLTSVGRQIGNAMPSSLAAAIGESISVCAEVSRSGKGRRRRIAA